MPVETGTLVKPGDLLVQIDTRDVQNQYDQAKAAPRRRRGEARRSPRAEEAQRGLFKARVITPQEYETASLDLREREISGRDARRANLDLAKQRLEDATVTAPTAGTIIDEDGLGRHVIASATSSVSGGTTLVRWPTSASCAFARSSTRPTSATSIRARRRTSRSTRFPTAASGRRREDRAAGRRAAERHDVPVLVTLDEQ